MPKELVGTTRPQRYFAAVIDSCFAMMLFFAVGSMIGNNSLTMRRDAISVFVGLAVASLYFVYFFVFEWLIGATPGKLTLGLTVCGLDGSRCSAKMAFWRTLTRILEVNPLLLGALPAAILVHFSERRQRFGDRLAGAVVVEKRLAAKLSKSLKGTTSALGPSEVVADNNYSVRGHD